MFTIIEIHDKVNLLQQERGGRSEQSKPIIQLEGGGSNISPAQQPWIDIWILNWILVIF